MGQNKINREFGQKLKEREIAPKADSWEKLASRLEEDTKKSGSYKWVLGIAASFIAGILILGQMARTNVVEEAPSIVETPAEIQEKDGATVNLENTQLAIEEVQKPVEKEKAQNKIPIKTPPVPQQETMAGINREVEKLSEESAIAEAVAEVTTEEPKENLPAGLQEAIASVSTTLAANDDLAEAEVDSLLMMAAAKISRERTVYIAGENIDAQSLLWDVEMEMEQSFREKVFDIMKEGYLKARTAVANRNY